MSALFMVKLHGLYLSGRLTALLFKLVAVGFDPRPSLQYGG
jgi:hypothetical protein